MRFENDIRNVKVSRSPGDKSADEGDLAFGSVASRTAAASGGTDSFTLNSLASDADSRVTEFITFGIQDNWTENAFIKLKFKDGDNTTQATFNTNPPMYPLVFDPGIRMDGGWSLDVETTNNFSSSITYSMSQVHRPVTDP